MDIYPEDFGPAYRARIQQIQKVQGLQGGTFVFGRGFDGFLGAICGMAPAMTLNLWLNSIPGTVPHSFFVAGGTGAAVGYVCGFFLDRYRRRRRDFEKVTAREINLLRLGETDSLKLDYFGFLSKLISMQSSLDMSAQKNISCALREIGSGIEKLPSQPAEDLLRDVRIFQQEELRLIAEASQETDPIVAASLQRQSVAQSQRGEAVSRNSAVARRNEVLRREMREQIRALTTMLGATALDDRNDSHNFSELAEKIQQVAIEAVSLTEAKRELAAVLEDGQGDWKNVTLEQPEYRRLIGQ